jgi:hypothetical protein
VQLEQTELTVQLVLPDHKVLQAHKDLLERMVQTAQMELTEKQF